MSLKLLIICCETIRIRTFMSLKFSKEAQTYRGRAEEVGHADGLRNVVGLRGFLGDGINVRNHLLGTDGCIDGGSQSQGTENVGEVHFERQSGIKRGLKDEREEKSISGDG